MSETELLLTAKLHRPRVTRDLVERPRLLSRLDAGLAGPLTIVVATAGFGKTTLVSSWIEELAAGRRPGLGVFPAAWISLDESDGDRYLFLRYFIAALRGVFPDAAPQTWQLLTARQNPPLDYLATMLSNEIESLPAEFVMVLDDTHALQGQAVYDLLTAWMRHWPRPLHLVLISRLNPSLSLANWRARGKVVELRSRDLRFTEAETGDFLARALGKNFAQDRIATLHGQMEGWIAGLRLATLSTAVGDELATLPAQVLSGDVYVADYLLEEVLLRQPPEIQQSLLTVSVTRQFCESLCAALLGGEDGVRAARYFLDYLEVHELLQVRLDGRGDWFRFHHLFSSLMQQRLQTERGPDAISDLHRVAARWYDAHGLPDEALYHAREASDTALLGTIVWHYLRDVLNAEDRPRLERWLAMVPNEAIDQRPELLIARAWDHAFRWEIAQLHRDAQQAEALLETGDTVTTRTGSEQLVRAHLAIIKGQAAYERNEPAITAVLCREGHDLLPAGWAYVRGVAAVFTALGLQSTDRAAEAVQFLTSRYEAVEDKYNGYALRLLEGLAHIALQSGRLESAHHLALTFLQHAESAELPIMQGWAHYLAGYVDYHLGALAAAETHYQAAAAMRYSTQLLVVRCAIAGLADVYAARGEFPRAMAQVDELNRLDLQRYGREEPFTVSARALLLVAQGDVIAAADWISAVNPPLDELPLLPWSERPLLARLVVLIALNRTDHASTILHELDILDKIAERTFNKRTPVALLALRAMALLAQGNARAARKALIRSVELARRTGHRQLYVDLGEPMQRLLRQIAAERTVSVTVHSILAAFPDGDSFSERVLQDDISAALYLTRRELEILQRMAEPVSVGNIAEELSITAATVKRHSIRVYDKLGVHSRWEAVAKAVELGILKSP